MTKRFDNLTKAQAELFERIACGDDTCVNYRVVQVLMDKGLVKQHNERDGMFTWFRFRVPIGVHVRWAEWCAGKG